MDYPNELLLQALGRLHPMLVHFPIAFLVLAGALEVFRRRDKPSDATLICLLLGSLGAGLAAWSGWEFFEHDGPGASRTMWLHRWGGVVVAGLAAVCLLLGLVARKGTRPRVMPFFRGGVVLGMVLVGFVAHQGGKSVWGDGFLLELFEDPKATEEASDTAEADSNLSVPERQQPPAEPETTPLVPILPADLANALAEDEAAASVAEPVQAQEPGTDLDPVPVAPVSTSTAVDFATQVRPIFAASCAKCHGSKRRPKAGLNLEDMPDVFAGAQEDWVIQPGNASASLLYERITLPTDHEDFMPSDGDPLTAAQVELIRKWIDEGAPYTASAESPSDTPEVADAHEPAPVVLPATLELGPEERAQRDATIERIRARGAFAGRVAMNTDEVEVNLGLLGEKADDESLAALQGLEPSLVSLDLSRSAVTSAGLARLEAFPRLRRLRLDHTAVDDSGMMHLAKLGSLEYLNLVGTQVGDSGLADLSGLGRLRKIFLWQTPVTEEGAEALASALPELEVVRDTYTPVVVEADAPADDALGSEAPARSAACCDSAKAAGDECDHPCCVEAATRGEICPTCSA